MLRGEFFEKIPYIKATIAWNNAVQTVTFVLDTGFTGDFQVTADIARDLGLEIIGVVPTRIANGSIISMPIAVALTSMEGITEHTEVMISEGVPLAGIGFLEKFEYKAIIDCKEKTVVLQR